MFFRCELPVGARAGRILAESGRNLVGSWAGVGDGGSLKLLDRAARSSLHSQAALFLAVQRIDRRHWGILSSRLTNQTGEPR